MSEKTPLTESNREPSAELLEVAHRLRQGLNVDIHEQVVEAIYEDAARLAGRAVTRPGEQTQPTLDRAIDRVVTSRIWGFPVMIALFALMFWLTISGANVPSALLADLLVDNG